MELEERLYQNGVLPVVVLDQAEQALPLARALLAGGLNMMEITLRTPAALEAIAAIRQGCPEMLAGAGTILELEQAQDAVEAGAQFLVSPGWLPEVAAWCGWGATTPGGSKEDKMRRWPYFPGCATPTEILAARQAGLRLVKFFPARVYGGPTALKDLAAPLSDMKFLPTGGVNPENLAEYLALPCVPAVGGTWLTRKEDVAAGEFYRITTLAREASQRVKELRS